MTAARQQLPRKRGQPTSPRSCRRWSAAGAAAAAAAPRCCRVMLPTRPPRLRTESPLQSDAPASLPALLPSVVDDGIAPTSRRASSPDEATAASRPGGGAGRAPLTDAASCMGDARAAARPHSMTAARSAAVVGQAAVTSTFVVLRQPPIAPTAGGCCRVVFRADQRGLILWRSGIRGGAATTSTIWISQTYSSE
jgi:hypothetical protein